MTVQIFTSVVNRPDFVEIQDKLFRKYMKEDYVFNVVDDSPTEDLAQQFKTICEKNNIVYYRKDQDPNKQNELFIKVIYTHPLLTSGLLIIFYSRNIQIL